MANKTSFSAEEWQQLLASPMVSAMAVTAADPSGLFGLVKEGFAASGALASAKSDADANPLIKAVVAEFETSEGRTAARDLLKTQFAGSQAASVKPNAIEALRKVSALLDTKAPEDARRLQGMAAGDRPAGGRGRQGRRFSRLRRRPR